ncbi:MAG: YceD family protein [Thiohalocapsa sp.]
MSVALPELLDPRRAVELRSRFEGRYSLARLARLRPLLENDAGFVRYEFICRRDENGYAVIAGRVGAELTVRCQCCNESLVLPVDSRPYLALVESIDEASALPNEYDPLLLDGRLMRSTDLVEDELILSVPTIPRHEEGRCQPPFLGSLTEPSTAAKDKGKADSRVQSERPNPFAELKVLKRDQGD